MQLVFDLCLAHGKELKFLLLSYSYQLRIYSDPTFSFIRDLAPPVLLSLCISSTSPFILRVTRLSGWPGTIPVYSYCPNIIISNNHFHSQKYLVWVIYYMVLFISDHDLQPCSCSNSPIPKTLSRQTHSKTYAQSHISLSLLHSHIFWKYCPYLFSPFFFAYHYSSTQLFLSSLLFWNYSGKGHSATSCSLNLLTCKAFWLGNFQAIFLSRGDVILLKYLFTLIFLTKTVNLLRFYHPCAHSQVTHVTYFNPLNNSVK